MLATTQKFTYKRNNEPKVYLLMPKEYECCRQWLSENFWSLERCFELWTGYSSEGVTDLKLEQKYHSIRQ